MAEIIRMPRMSDTMTEGVIVAWHKKVGDNIKSGDLLAEVETDKATMEMESYWDGTLLYIGVEKGNAVAVDGVLAIIGKKGEDYKSLLEGASVSSTKKQEQSSAKKETSTSSATVESVVAHPQTSSDKPQTTNGRMKASPLAKKIAKDKGVDLAKVKGTGDGGRVIKRDIEKISAGKKMDIPVFVGEEGYEDVPLSQMRKTIARRLVESKNSAPHFYLTMEINMDKMIEARKSINEISDPVKISYNDLITKASALALRNNPKVNASWLNDKIRYYKHIHIGVAVAVEEGLVVPVIRFADGKPLSQIAVETKDFAEKAKNKKLQPTDWEGNTFTISNLGMFDIDEFTAIINPPDACILAVGKIKQVPIIENGQLKNTNVMKVTLSCDHRVVDGALGSMFLQTLKSYLEDPIRLVAFTNI